ncbi:putative spermidine/putrescine transport system permease protein [Halarchaeum solikamskense]|uniref:ABC transporter permease n=1 Tax=Halarchaeum nitratireducens TaxID=489913 RepID=UPI001B3B124E|nr:putative spermidine/putrescine transport system permease protein [Halarchaeum solikamskense]
MSQWVQRIHIGTVLKVYAFLIGVYVFLPLLSVIGFSFNSGGLTFPFLEFTTRWYTELLNSPEMIAAIVRSLQLALVVTVITTVISTATALAYRRDFWGQKALLYVLLVGIITPGITYGVGATLLFNQTLGLSKQLWLAVPVHVVWTVPFAVIVLLAGFPPHLAQNERAAKMMGASRLTRFREVTLPQIMPTVLGAAVFAFTLSYNEATRGLLLIGQDMTMPIRIFSIASSRRATPELFALGSLTTIVSVLLLVGAGALVVYGSKR